MWSGETSQCTLHQYSLDSLDDFNRSWRCWGANEILIYSHVLLNINIERWELYYSSLHVTISSISRYSLEYLLSDLPLSESPLRLFMFRAPSTPVARTYGRRLSAFIDLSRDCTADFMVKNQSGFLIILISKGVRKEGFFIRTTISLIQEPKHQLIISAGDSEGKEKRWRLSTCWERLPEATPPSSPSQSSSSFSHDFPIFDLWTHWICNRNPAIIKSASFLGFFIRFSTKSLVSPEFRH